LTASERLQAAGVAVLVAVGLLGVLAALAGSPRIAGVSRVLVASPMPLVFGRQGGVELTARRFELELLLVDGSSRIERRAPTIQAALRGPFSVTAPYASVLLFFPIVPEPRRSAILRRGVCGKGPIAEALALPAPVRRFQVRTWSELATDEPAQSITLECPA
jgi:hypothetical protein